MPGYWRGKKKKEKKGGKKKKKHDKRLHDRNRGMKNNVVIAVNCRNALYNRVTG